jgi:hypothetical protein
MDHSKGTGSSDYPAPGAADKEGSAKRAAFQPGPAIDSPGADQRQVWRSPPGQAISPTGEVIGPAGEAISLSGSRS